MITLPTDEASVGRIWTPDLLLYNTAERPLENLLHTYATVQRDGTVTWSQPGVVTATCSFDLTEFPYDTQVCELRFGSK